MFRLVTFGGLALARDDPAAPPRIRPQRLAILAVLAHAGERGVSRDWLARLFWPDADEERSRHSLRQALYALRHELGTDVIQSGGSLVLDRAVITADVTDFRQALIAGDHAGAAALATAPFLHGFSLPGAPEFDRWVEEQRTALLADATRVVLALAREAGHSEAGVEWWRRLTRLDPLSGRFALGYLRALAEHGDRAGALAFARSHQELVRRELEADADPEIRRLEAELRALPSPDSRRPAGSVTDASPATGASPSLLHLLPAPEGANPSAMTVAESATGHRRLRAGAAGAAVLLLIAAGAALFAANRSPRPGPGATFAVGMIREDGVPDSLRIGRVVTDMLATNLARVAGLSVLASSRLLELMLPGQDTLVAGYTEAARRAGATEIFQGRLLAGPPWVLALEIERVDLATGIVRGAYRVYGTDRHALVDSATTSIARDLRLALPSGSVADATTDSPVAYRLYEEGLRAYFRFDHAAARRLMQAALEEDSTFAMAAYYDALLVPSGRSEIAARERALRLAVRAPERERLRITADMLALNMEPSAVVVAESLSTRFPDDPRSFELLASARWFRGDWAEAVRAIERAIALDSASEAADARLCRLCHDLDRLADIYMWWDSLPAVDRTALRYRRLRPNAHAPWELLARRAATRGDTAAMQLHYRRFYDANPLETRSTYPLRLQMLAESYDEVSQGVLPWLNSPRLADRNEGRWLWSIALRNQGRLGEAMRIAQQHADERSDPDRLLEALVALEQGNSARLASIFAVNSREDESEWPPGVQARHITWSKTLYGMALAAAGDTLELRQLVDTVQAWGARSLYGRDRRAHHYLRGLLLIARRQDSDAVEELRAAIHSPTHGFTRINLELARTLLRLKRPAEAVPVVRSALHGGIDGSNLYVTRTELHEVLAQAFDRLGIADSAAVHYRAVVRGWARSDPAYRARLELARAWLAASSRPLE